VWKRSAVVDARQRADPIPALLRPQSRDEGKLHVAPRLDLLVEQLGVALIVRMIEEGVALRIARAQPAVVELEAAVRRDEAQRVGIDGCKPIVILGVRQDDALDELNPLLGPVDDSDRCRPSGGRALRGSRSC
jgi:hypothetical protein